MRGIAAIQPCRPPEQERRQDNRYKPVTLKNRVVLRKMHNLPFHASGSDVDAIAAWQGVISPELYIAVSLFHFSGWILSYIQRSHGSGAVL